MIRRFGNVVFAAALLVLGALVINMLNAASPAAAWDGFMSSVVVATLIAVVRYILRGRL